MFIIFVLALSMSAIFVTYSSADDVVVNCPGTITEDVEDTLILEGSGNCTLASGVQATNDVKVSDGVSFIVRGTVDGKVEEEGSGRVVVNGGTVNNDVLESGSRCR